MLAQPSMPGDQRRWSWHPQARVRGENRRNASDFAATSMRLPRGNLSGVVATSERLRGGNTSDAMRLRHRLLRRAGASAIRRQDDGRTRIRSRVSDMDIEIIQRILRRQQIEEQMARRPRGLVPEDGRRPVIMTSPCTAAQNRRLKITDQHNGSAKSRGEPLPPTVHEACAFEGERGKGWWLHLRTFDRHRSECPCSLWSKVPWRCYAIGYHTICSWASLTCMWSIMTAVLRQQSTGAARH